MFASESAWLNSGWLVAGVWAFCLLDALFKIGMAWLAVHMLRRDVERAGKILLAVAPTAGQRVKARTRRFAAAGIPLFAVALFVAWMSFSTGDWRYAIPFAGLLLIATGSSTAVSIALLRYCPQSLEIHEHGLFYPAHQPLQFVAWKYVRWYAIRQYRSTAGPEHRLIVQAPAHCLNLPVRDEHVAELEACLEEYLPVGGTERRDDRDRA
jgi:hypothetical protein